MDPAVPWQYTYNRLAAQGAASGDLHHHFAQAANNSALGGSHGSSVSAVPSTTSQLLLQAAHSTPLGASSASFATPSSFLSAPSYDVFSPLFHHANPKPAHFNPINAAAQHRQQVLAAQAAVTKQTTDSDIIRENYTPHHSSISTPQTGSYFEQPSGSAVAAAAALSWQARGQTDFTTLRSQGDLNTNNQLPSAFGILPHENVASSPAPSTATKHSSSSGSSTGVYESFNAHFSQPINQANAIIKSSSTARSMSPQQSQQQIKQQTIASTSAPSTSVYYQTPSQSSPYQNLQSSFANSKSIGQQEQLQHQQPQQHSNYSNSSNHTISGKNNRSGSMQPTSTQIPPHQGSTQNHLTLLATTNNALSHHNQSSQQQQSHMQHTTSHTGQNVNNSQSSSSNQMSQQKTTPLTDKKFPTPTGPGSGFMQSYLKFLQGERDTSPPPVNRGGGGGRKTWSRGTNQATVSSAAATAASNQTSNAKNQMTNGMNINNTMVGGTSIAYDRKRIANAPTDDDDDTSDSSNYKSTNKNSKKQSQQSVVERAPQVPINAAKKARTTQSSHTNSLLSSQTQSQTSNALSLQQNHSLQQNQQLLMQQHAATSAHQLVAGTSQILSQQQMYYPQDEDPLSVPQARRETSHRKAKGRSIMSAMQKQALGLDVTDDLDEPPEFVDSDTDPAWTPQKTNDDDDDDDMPRRKVTRKTRTTNRSGVKRATTKSQYDTENTYSDFKQKSSNSSSTQLNYGTSGNINNQDLQTGDFIISRQDIFQDWPAIWRVNSKTLLQKFEPFHSNNKTVYRSLSTYAQWSLENRPSYILVKCSHVGQLQHELHVELQRSDLCSVTSEMYIEKVIQEFSNTQEQFEVYIQTLISQALDSNFLTEIMQEQDEYFISNVKTIDDLTTQRKLRLRNTMTAWPTRMLHLIETWPCSNIIDCDVTNNGQIICVACNKRNITSKIILYGQPYNPIHLNPNTIGPASMDSRFSLDKDFLLCRSCLTQCELLHKIAHQKYLMFMQCSQKVAEKNAQDPTKGSTVILNELLADEAWLGQLFKTVRRAWAEVDQIERQQRFSS
ncbi:uncharacterized protein LOC116339086 isoform X3 [Contarinia nasturtii]|uniref:uncharacterized protein LOC116339086 isoform X3 n=1 Tax=Contarinia nasturtii TaxID=265458 RepID=UPI0012D3A19C|nr:uncharacterized protein LOC116339086 isoform X3 [Contarinia nasturtii]